MGVFNEKVIVIYKTREFGERCHLNRIFPPLHKAVANPVRQCTEKMYIRKNWDNLHGLDSCPDHFCCDRFSFIAHKFYPNSALYRQERQTTADWFYCVNKHKLPSTSVMISVWHLQYIYVTLSSQMFNWIIWDMLFLVIIADDQK